MAKDFGASNEDVALIPTLAQAGYAIGSLFISPLGDLVRRRPLVLLLVTVYGLLSIGLALARSVALLQGLTFVVGITTVHVSLLNELIDR
jgi:MFS family permease